MNQILITPKKFYLNNPLGKRYVYPNPNRSSSSHKLKNSMEIPVIVERSFRQETANELGVFIKQIGSNLQNLRKPAFFKFQFLISSVSLAIILITLFFYWKASQQNDEIAKELVSHFNIARLYSSPDAKSQNNASPLPLEIATTDLSLNASSSFPSSVSVIGLIEIPSIQLNYPILSEINDELLKISPCKFYGPNPNEIGNLCIAGHNYDNYKFFSKIHKLKEGSTIKIHDLSR